MKYKQKAILFETTPLNRDMAIFSPLKQDDKEAILSLCKTLKLTHVYLSEVGGFEDEDNDVMIPVPQKKWNLTPITDIINDSHVVYNIEWLLTHDLTLKNKKQASLVCKVDNRFLAKLSSKLLTDKEFILSVIGDDKLDLRNTANIHIKSGYDFHYLETVLEHFNDDKDIVLKVLPYDAYSYIFTAPALKNDRDVVLTAVKSDSEIFQYVGESYKDDFDVAIASWIDDEESTFNQMSDRLKILFIFGMKMKATC